MAEPDNAASRYPVPSLDALPDDIRARIEEVQEKSGFVPNVFLAFAHRPDEFRAFFAYHDALMLRDSGLSKAEREMIVVATSAANDCGYCVIAHGAILRIYAKNPLIADQLAVNYRGADITPRQRAMLDFAVKLARTPELTDEHDREMLEAHGFSAEDIWDIGAITALFALSNRMAHLTTMRPNDEFYLMGRLPRSR
ncbi:MAG: peroxidase-related enzyme [Pseudomonadales bacterium]